MFRVFLVQINEKARDLFIRVVIIPTPCYTSCGFDAEVLVSNGGEKAFQQLFWRR